MAQKPKEDWSLHTDPLAEEGPSSWQLRESFPVGFVQSEFQTAVIVELRYAEGGRPSPQALKKLHEFESLLDPLNDGRYNSLLVHIVRGDGVSELCYYCKSYEQFIKGLMTCPQ
jgi:hypothetical protein